MSILTNMIEEEMRKIRESAGKERTPNAETREALHEASEGRNLTYHDSLESFKESMLAD